MDATPHQMVPSDFGEVEAGFPELPSPEVAAPLQAARAAGIAALHEIPVKVQAVLGGARMQINQLLQTRVGSVIELDRRVGEPVDVIVNDRLIARGELVLIDGSLGITLTEIVKQER